MKNLIYIVLALFLATGCKKKAEQNTEEHNVHKTPVAQQEATTPSKVIIDLQSKSGSSVVGRAVFTQEEDGSVKLEALFGKLNEGTHAIHLHEKADCSSDDGKSSGGHWNPTAQPHGKWGAPEGFHIGDIGNFEADAEGKGSVNFSTDQWCIGCGDNTKDILGKAVIVHEGTDDFTSQPSGAAGTRVSCGGVIQ